MRKMSDESAVLSKTERQLPDYGMLARLVIREGKSFKESAVRAGYAASVAARGLKALCEDSKPVAEAIRRETESCFVGLDKLKPLAVRRLHDEIANPKSAGGLKAIEIAGRFKETDWFVRNADVQIGVFAALANNAELDAGALAIEAYKEPEKD
jgi:hypothetical protein